jgi:hypothetical protein
MNGALIVVLAIWLLVTPAVVIALGYARVKRRAERAAATVTTLRAAQPAVRAGSASYVQRRG